jgi:hypothetical protein
LCSTVNGTPDNQRNETFSRPCRGAVLGVEVPFMQGATERGGERGNIAHGRSRLRENGCKNSTNAPEGSTGSFVCILWRQSRGLSVLSLNWILDHLPARQGLMHS